MDIPREIRQVLEEQKFGVLCTQSQGRPYASLVTFASTHDLYSLLIATSPATRKFANLAARPRAALLVDNRANTPEDLQQAIALTATGATREVHARERAALAEGDAARHPELAEFVEQDGTALICLEVEWYFVANGLSRGYALRMR
ncbi:MAG: pyridoxamine 5'-phosphate oxidase family protein [bacterium]|jgi:nitroimidazol reductase NimA-like FMN-containing flavoprotein (pyridoxamine 5'-phosphate oxidase superfamily)|nr:pyridoxamine 5'-phosphate oxidase family protein [candidate division KSB1 bacterium]MDH7561588.1 pyridoxamine 5'-phosphate oxidase family protein [bacterium]